MISEHEEEIKIEYLDTCTSDPLSENLSNVSIKTIFYNEYDRTSDNFENKSTESKSNSLTQENGIINWYKEIDLNGRYACRYCDSKYSTVQTLRFHIKRKHCEEAKNLQTMVSNNKRKHKIKCHVCNQKFQSINDLEVHFKKKHLIHDSVNKSCIYCDATFESVNELTLHQLNVHSKVKKVSFLCSICGYRTWKKSHFNQHQNTHLAFKSHKCNFCDYCTNYLPNLKIHERIHTNNKPYKCDYKNCMYVCVAKSALRSHQLKHFPNENMLFCDKCNYKTVYKQSLKKHQGVHNKNSISFLDVLV